MLAVFFLLPFKVLLRIFGLLIMFIFETSIRYLSYVMVYKIYMLPKAAPDAFTDSKSNYPQTLYVSKIISICNLILMVLLNQFWVFTTSHMLASYGLSILIPFIPFSPIVAIYVWVKSAPTDSKKRFFFF